MNVRSTSSLLAAALVATVMAGGTAWAQEHTLRLSTLLNPNSDGVQAAEELAARVAERTEGRVQINVYPANQLGDWVEVHEQVMLGAVDMAMQPFSTSYDPRLAIAWFPYTVTTYESAEKAFTEGGYLDKIVGDIVADQGIKLLGIFGVGMGGAGFASEIENAADPNASHDLKIRVWPGGTTHQVLMERLGYNTATVPWAELYTGMQTGVVDGQIGGTPKMALDNFKDVTETWIQYNDHFEPAWIFINQNAFDQLSEDDQQVLMDVAQEITRERFEAVIEADQTHLQTMRDAGIDVITFDEATLENFARVTREDVWPEITDQIGEDAMATLKEALDLN